MEHLKTTAVAKLLGVAYVRLAGLIRYGRIEAPAKDSSGDYIWAPEDVERAKAALAGTRCAPTTAPVA